MAKKSRSKSSNDMDMRYCMFCGRSEKEVPFLLQGMDACICSDCVSMAQGYINEIIDEK